MIIDKLHQQFNDLCDLRMREIRVDRQVRKVFCTLSHPQAQGFDVNLRTQIINIVKSDLPKGYTCSVKFVDDEFTDLSFRRILIELIKNRYPIYANIPKTKIDVGVAGRYITVVFNVNEVVKRNFEVSEFCEKLSEYFAEYTCYQVEFVVRLDTSSSPATNVEEQEKLVQFAINRELLKPSRYFSISNVDVVFGKQITASPMYIADVRRPMDACVVCGTISNKTTRVAKSNPMLNVCSFTLTDGTGHSMSCILFLRLQITDVSTIMSETGKGEAEAKTLSEKRILANDKKLKLVATFLTNGDSVVVRGKVAYNRDGSSLEMCVYDLCKCKIEAISTQREYINEPASQYLIVRPEDFTEYRQINFVDDSTEKSVISEQDFVVLHVNATGLGKVIEDKLYAISAVKVAHGHVTERLFTYINPERNDELDVKLLEACGITQNKLIFYPTLTEIISDLYKFTYGCTLVGVNLGQILDILNYYASPFGYLFKNKTVVQSDLLGELFENSILEVSINTSKIDDVAKKCRVECPSTVFCADTALTVARCMSYLSYNAK
ncbi:MAG: hypothetical protein J1G02_03675 [Clostridiales bacterium]|nr:hypothetical protein [Clostridiales bacterium]